MVTIKNVAAVIVPEILNPFFLSGYIILNLHCIKVDIK